MPQRYSHQRREASTAAARRMERRHGDQGRGNSSPPSTPSSHHQRSKKLAMLSRSLILCHSKTNDDCLEEGSHGCRTWGPGGEDGRDCWGPNPVRRRRGWTLEDSSGEKRRHGGRP
ncbi:hypothetical protein CesoFtcFv8_001667 [Champsocephalus esox]|uniref:Uncharacterized protein n=1 Tax=Champsocephalus esox TaxID=159716 RepID=A0AAN8D996_9TELE|nr:hypothetical protein CesoFtcFv8_001667 [Champsocephalus esox]